MAVPRIDIVTAMYNEEESFAAYVDAIERVLMSRTDAEYRITFVDDGSTDSTWDLVEAHCRSNPRYRALRLSRNFGEHAAITAGLDHSEGDAAATLAADLQDPPEAILEFVEAWRGGTEIVWGHRRTRVDDRARVWTGELFAMLLRRFAMPKGSKFTTGSFLLLDRKVVACLRQMREQGRLTFALVAWVGFRQAVVQYDRRPRLAGKSGWTFGRMIIAMYDAVVGFSSVVPRMVTVVGITFSAIGLLAAVYFFLNAIFDRPHVQGWAGIMVTLTLFFGITFFILGTICEYLLRIYREAVHRPLYFVANDTAKR